MLRPNRPLARICRQLTVSERKPTTICGGSRLSEQHELIVSPQARPSIRVVTITTPAASARMASLNISLDRCSRSRDGIVRLEVASDLVNREVPVNDHRHPSLRRDHASCQPVLDRVHVVL